MHSTQINGLPVISIAEGERLGTVVRTYVDPSAKRVVGFAYDTGSGLFSPDSAPRMDAGCVRSLGPDTLLLDDKASVRGDAINATIASLTTLDELTGRAVLTSGGASVGHIAGVTFDERSFAITELAISRGMLAGTWSAPIAQVVAIGRDFVIVTDGIWTHDGAGVKLTPASSGDPPATGVVEAPRVDAG